MYSHTTAAAASAPHARAALSNRAMMVSWLLQLVVAGILLQTLFFKFTGAEESIYIFKTLGMEPWGRIGSGVAELAACVLLLIPRTVVFGAVLTLGVISGAVMSHLTRLGIVVKDDGGLLFSLSLVTLLASAVTLWLRRNQLLAILRAVRPRARRASQPHAANPR